MSSIWLCLLPYYPLQKTATLPLNEMDNGSVTFTTVVIGCSLLLNTTLLSLLKSHTPGFLRVGIQREFGFYFLFPPFIFLTEEFLRYKQTNLEY